MDTVDRWLSEEYDEEVLPFPATLSQPHKHACQSSLAALLVWLQLNWPGVTAEII